MCGSYDNEVRIERLANGFKVRLSDPKIVKQNKERDAMPYDSKNRPPYQSPQREYVFTSVKAITAFLTANLDKMMPAGDFSSSFDSAVAAAEED